MCITLLNHTVGTVVLYTPEEDTIILRFIIFEDGNVFEFYGNYGSLRSYIKISSNDAQDIIYNSKSYTYNENITDYRLFDILKNGIISNYTQLYNDNDNKLNYIHCCFILNDSLTNIFTERMLKTEMVYSTTDCLDLFNKYKNYIKM